MLDGIYILSTSEILTKFLLTSEIVVLYIGITGLDELKEEYLSIVYLQYCKMFPLPFDLL